MQPVFGCRKTIASAEPISGAENTSILLGGPTKKIESDCIVFFSSQRTSDVLPSVFPDSTAMRHDDILHHDEVMRLLAKPQACFQRFGLHHCSFSNLRHGTQVQSLREEKQMTQQSSNVRRNHCVRLLCNENCQTIVRTDCNGLDRCVVYKLHPDSPIPQELQMVSEPEVEP